MNRNQYFYSILIGLALLLGGCQTEPENPPLPALAQVSQPQIFAYRGDQTVQLTWGWFTWGETDPSRTDPESFLIQMSENGGQDWIEVAEVGGGVNSFEISGLTNDRIYQFMVEAKAANAQSSLSNLILVMPGKDGELIDLFEGLSGDRYWGSFGLEGAYISYSKAIDESNFVYRYSLTEQREYEVFSGDFSDWSPIGDQIAFLTQLPHQDTESSQANSIVLFSENGPIVLLDGKSQQRELAWSTDGNSLVFLSDLDQENQFSIWRLELRADATPVRIFTDTDLPVQLEDPLDRSPRSPIWDTEQKRIIFSRFVEKDSLLVRDIIAQDESGSGQQPIVSSQWNDLAPALSPSGDRLAFVSDRSGVEAIWVLDLLSGDMRQLTGDRRIQLAEPSQLKLDWHPDGSSLLFTGIREDGTKTLMLIRSK